MMGDPFKLLGRAEHAIDVDAIMEPLRGQRILVTGAAGTIGSAVSAWLHEHHEGELICCDRDESRLYQMGEALAPQHPQTHLVLADVALPEDMIRICERYRPDLVIHAAAYKHVPLLEDHSYAAQRNNVEGTRTALRCAMKANALCRFVLVSTDKAVYAANVMGKTKRHAELLVLAQGETTVVRFGNVLGSSNSVVDIWLRQVERGQEITVTDPEMTRFFMTLNEAAALVLSAAGDDEAVGRICVPDMGEPIRMGDLASRFVKANGGAMVFTAPRPGEKPAERLTHDNEYVLHDRGRYRIYVARQASGIEATR